MPSRSSPATSPSVSREAVGGCSDGRKSKGKTKSSSPPRNIVVFGDSGVGKSSLINMIAGKKCARVSSGAVVCTFMSTRYDISFDDEEFTVWDTTGLNAGTLKRGKADTTTATRTLSKLLQLLEGGIQLLVYVVRGSNVGRALAKNYTIFYSAISRKKVPIAVVVTGLENEQGEMEDWWKDGEGVLAGYEMHFHAHACVTTLAEEKTRNTVLASRGRYSQFILRRMIKENCRHGVVEYTDTRLWISTALADVRSLMSSGPRWDRQPVTNVVIRGGDGLLANTAITGEWESCSTRIKEHSFTFHNASRGFGSVAAGLVPGFMRRHEPDLLVYVSQETGHEEDSLATLRTFRATYHGEVCPLVLIASDQGSSERWKRALESDGIDATVTFVPPRSSDGSGSQPLHLHDIIANKCLVRGVSRSASRRKKNLEQVEQGTDKQRGYVLSRHGPLPSLNAGDAGAPCIGEILQ